jgi:carbonic anhydrase
LATRRTGRDRAVRHLLHHIARDRDDGPLIGIGAGIVLELLLNLWYVGLWHTLRNGSEFAKPNFAVRFLSLFRNPVSERELDEGTYHLYLDGPLVCFNLFHVIRELGNLPRDTQAVYLHLSSRVPLVDHTTGESLRHFLEEFSGQDQSPRLMIEGWDHMRPLSKHETSTRLALANVHELEAAQATD